MRLIKHNHVMIKFNKSIKLIYNDVRKFGFIKIVPLRGIKKNNHIKLLGPEPLNSNFNIKYLKFKSKEYKKNVKNLLMDQRLVSGLGNIYVNEILTLVLSIQEKTSKNLKNYQIKKIIKNIKTILLKAIKLGGSSIRDFKGFQVIMVISNRSLWFMVERVKICRKIGCQGKIKKIYISNRSTFYCLKCQK